MARRIRKNVGVIGLGIIGSRVAENLRKKGYRVFVWNRTPKPVPNFVGSIGELAEMCDYIQIFVSDDGSTDGTREYVRQIALQDPRVHLLIDDPIRGLFTNVNHLVSLRARDE